MSNWHALVLLLAAAAGPWVSRGLSQTIRLEPGEYRWWPIHVGQAPAAVGCRFEVVTGGPTVHAELMPRDDFRAFARNMDYDTLAATGDAKTASFSRIIPDRGDYAVVIVNRKNAPPAMVSLSIETNLNPTGAGIARTLPPRRRLVVLLVSFGIFFVTVGWSGHSLIRAMKDSAE